MDEKLVKQYDAFPKKIIENNGKCIDWLDILWQLRGIVPGEVKGKHDERFKIFRIIL